MTHPLPCECHEGYVSGLHATRRQHLSGIHPHGGRVPPTEPVRQRIDHPGGIGPPPTEMQQRWAAAVAARDDRMPDETDMVTHTYQPDAA